MNTRLNDEDWDPDDESVINRNPESGLQSGDLQGIDSGEDSESETVQELLEEGQYYEAEVLSGIENAPPADEQGVRTRQVPEDDVPLEYLEQDERDI